MKKDPYKYYRIEARELLDDLSRSVFGMNSNGADLEGLRRVLRLAHTLKGAARVVKQANTSELAHRFEELIQPHRTTGNLPSEVLDGLISILDSIERDLAALDGAGTAAEPAPAAATSAHPSAVQTQGPPSSGAPTSAIPAMAGPAAPAQIASAQTAPRTPTQAVPAIAAQAPVAPAFETPSSPEATLAAAASSPPAAELARAEELRASSVRVEIADIDSLQVAAAEIAMQLSALRRHWAALEQARHMANILAEQLSADFHGMSPAELVSRQAQAQALQALLNTTHRAGAAGIERSQSELGEVRERALTMRLLPASTVFGMLERGVHDVARALGKDIRFFSRGGEQRLDGQILGPLAEALLHVVRNAADHGIETAAERASAHKPPHGAIELHVERRSNRVVFTCADDGRGLDFAAIRQAAIDNQRLTSSQAQALDEKGLAELILSGGLSTKGKITEISGRGIGMDVLRDCVDRLKGSVRVYSEHGRGTRFEIEVPVSLSAMPVLILQSGQTQAAIALHAVRRVVQVTDREILRSPQSIAIAMGATVLPLSVLATLFGDAPALRARSDWTVLVLESRAGVAALAIDRLVDQMDLAVRPLPQVVGEIPLVLGASLDADGDVMLVLDPEGLVQAARTGRGRPQDSATLKTIRRILVIDDSLTTRMLEQSILESAGYVVDLAVSGEEGMEKARAGQYALFVVDVEMPGMSGFDFVEKTRADAQLRHTPAILVTSLSSPAHRRRGLEVGARAYIVKGEFEQGAFMNTVRMLAG